MGDFWKTTSDLFSGFIEKPKMTEKLLQKPPFKYLFDIISETTKKSGWGNGNGLRTNSCNKFMPVQLPKSHLILMSIKFWARLKSNMKNHKKKKLNLNQNRSKSNRQSKMTKRKLRDHHLQLEQKNLNL